MPISKSVEEIAAAIEEMNPTQRSELLLRIAKIDDILEELEDVADLIHAAQEPSRPFVDFLSELKAEGHDV
ncbi:MAG: hypothetical protein NT018_01495 [Armatimonadetes bacterium]|nr:hypothetical protein [Armatimonadota bacterium]